MPDSNGDAAEEVAEGVWAGCRAFLQKILWWSKVSKGMQAMIGNRAPLHPWEETNWQFAQNLLQRLGIIKTWPEWLERQSENRRS